MERQFVMIDQISAFVREAFGSSRPPVDIARLAGGTKKGVYRLTVDDGSSAILYVWGTDENYWPQSRDEHSDPLSDASGADLFEASHAQFDAIGIRTPRLYLMDRSKRHYPADLALIEDIRGGTLADFPASETPLALLGEALQAMAQHRSTQIGKVAMVENGKAPQDRRPEQVVLDRVLRHLAIVAERVEGIASAKNRIEDLVHRLAAAVQPRDSFGLVHGELGPDHVFLDTQGYPVIIDIEGAMFFDIEWDHAFVKMRFGGDYSRLQQPGLDAARLSFYRIAQSLSLIEGPLRIADGDFPGRDAMLGIAQWHIKEVLSASYG